MTFVVVVVDVVFAVVIIGVIVVATVEKSRCRPRCSFPFSLFCVPQVVVWFWVHYAHWTTGQELRGALTDIARRLAHLGNAAMLSTEAFDRFGRFVFVRTFRLVCLVCGWGLPAPKEKTTMMTLLS